ncbi:MAG TPA: MBL fold metallo-hydrolase [Gammaproteobacteria bacterium]|nr:MBL fold metallo-hydrolase [Gammaproteobacteria bacterium]
MLWVMVLLLFSPAAFAADIWKDAPFEPTDVAMELLRLSEHCYYVQGQAGTATDNQGFIANAGVVITDEGVVVFDALGSPSLAWLLLSKIRALTDKPIVKVVTSHYHADHIYGLQVFKAEGAEIIAPAGALDYLADETAESRLQERRESLFPWVNDDTRLITPDQLITTQQRFQLGGVRFVVRLVGSTHSTGDQIMQVLDDGVLFSGDLIFQGRIPLVAGSHPQAWLEGLQSLRTDDLKVLVPGHGPASRKPAKAIEFTRDYLRYLHQGMAEAVENLTPFEEAYAAVDWSAYEHLPAFIANRLNAYYVYLGLEAKSMAD